MIKTNICGYSSHHPANTRIISKNGNSDYLLLMINSKASVIVNGHTYFTTPNTLILFDKNIPYNYGSTGEDYRDDWIHFDFAEEEPSFKELGLPLNIPIVLPEASIFASLITLLVNEFYSNGPYRCSNVDHYMHILLQKLSEHLRVLPDSPQSHPHYAALNHLRVAIQNAPYMKWTIGQMAEELHMSPSRFQHLYKAVFGISCINDVIDIRIEYARHHLKTTNLSIQNIAQLCGYENDVHFIRQFKKQVGVTPGEYRKNIPVNTANGSKHMF
jgi:AraC family transcriptional regulator of arabinose operon